MSKTGEPKRITVDISTFRDLIEGNFLYIDKTEYLYKLIAKGAKYYFLSRPRRFGKSLTVSTLESIFSGEKELFKSLYIYDRYDFTPYPVIHLNLSALSVASGSEFLLTLKRSVVMPQAKALDALSDLPEEDVPSLWMNHLITAAKEKYGKKVVILIDEYDSALLDSDGTPAQEIISEYLDGFYRVLDAQRDNIRFCFITGVTRFRPGSGPSLIEGLVDLTERADCAAMLGYTDEEFDNAFAPYLERHYAKCGLTDDREKAEFRNRIRKYYDGYRFTLDSPQTVYNPVSVGTFFDEGCLFKNYWISTGMQTIVQRLLEKYPQLFRGRLEFAISENSANSFEASTLFSEGATEDAIYSYLLQAGYLTYLRTDGTLKVLGYPNYEVSDSVNASIISSMGPLVSNETIDFLRKGLVEEDLDAVVKAYENVFFKFPYDMKLSKEENFHAAFFAFSLATKFSVEAEEKMSRGKMDIRIAVRDDLYYIIELKVASSAAKAVRQVVSDREYYRKFEKPGRRIHVIGIRFSKAKRNVESWDKVLIQC